MRDVIRGTDLPSGTFYNYFPDQESVFRAVLEESAQAARRRLRDVRVGPRTLDAFVGDAYRAWFEFLVEDRLMFELMQRNVEGAAAFATQLFVGGIARLGSTGAR